MEDYEHIPALKAASEAIRAWAARLPDTPAVYRMIGKKDQVLYVGKAKSLKKRVLSYANMSRHPERTKRMLILTVNMEFVHTHTESEALLLEGNLIKKYKPYFNILLRDDKSFPYIFVSGDHDFPTVMKHRGARNRKGEYFGPFAGAGDVNRTIAMLQRAFMLRNCTDSYFAQRKRPCLQYHIKRCTAPCMNLVSKEQYAEQIGEARAFLQGKSREAQNRMLKAMEKASADMDYEAAASYRDRIRTLTYIQSTQDISIQGVRDADIFALAEKNGQSCVQAFFFRGGQNYGNRPYFPRHDPDETGEAILSAFLAQFYENKPLPKEIIVNHAIDDKALLEEAFSARAERKINIITPSRGARERLLEFARKNAMAALERHLAESASERQLLEKAGKLFGLEETPERIEVYDNSHISGTNMVGAMIVAGPEGFRKTAYRKFNIRTADAADDYGMMREVLSRRFKKGLQENPDMDGETWPDIVLIDGGLGQYNAVKKILEEFGIFNSLTLVAISKGPDRHAGREKFFVMDKAGGVKNFDLPINDPALHYFQRLRDEAHRFAIATHRAKRQKDIARSALDEIPGIGARRKKALLHHFGSAKAVADAGVEDLQKVTGVSRSVAQKIYDHFH